MTAKLKHKTEASRDISDLHYAFKTLAYTMINRRHFCFGSSTPLLIADGWQFSS
jgi:hypothetical protein